MLLEEMTADVWRTTRRRPVTLVYGSGYFWPHKRFQCNAGRRDGLADWQLTSSGKDHAQSSIFPVPLTEHPARQLLMFVSGWMVLLAMAAWEEHRSCCSAGWRAGCVGMRSKAQSDILGRPGAYQAPFLHLAYVLVGLIVWMMVACVSHIQDMDARCGLVDTSGRAQDHL